MGASSSCKIWESFSTALEWIAKSKLAISGVLHLLDDFLLIDKTFSACEQNLSRFLAMCDDLGVPMAPEKTMDPSSFLRFAGIELDSDKMEARLPEEKLRKCVTLIYEFLKRKKVSLKEMQSLIGLLNFTCSVVIPGRTFLRRMINLTVGVNRPTHLIRLTRIVKDDLKLWLEFLTQFNGKSFFLDFQWLSSPHLHLYTDASGSLGYGAVFHQNWFYSPWPPSRTSKNIIVLEMFLIVLSTKIWGTQLVNKCITFHIDNQALLQVINKKTTKDRELFRYFFLGILFLFATRLR